MKEQIRNQYTLFAKEVALKRDLIRDAIPPGSRADDLYKGTVILFSDIFYQPEFLFIGINPGAGFFKATGIKYRESELDPDCGFEYILAENEYDYTLARETRELFRRSSFANSLNQAVKSNLFYTCTTSAYDLHEFNRIVLETTDINLWELSAQWTKKLIQLISPKVVICEGKYVVDRLSEYYSVKVDWQGEVCRFNLPLNIKAIGYKRRYSNIRNPEALLQEIENTGSCGAYS